MSKKEMFKNEILLKMKYHLDKDSMGMLDAALSEALYRVDLVEQETLPATIENTNEYILELYMLKRGTTLAESTIKAYVDNCREFLRYMGGKQLTMITQEDVEHYLRQKIREGNRGTTMNNHRRNLNAIFRFMKQYKFITENPMENIEPYKEIHQPVECLAPEDVEVMKEACKNKRDRALLEWLRSTATRKGEIPDVKINQINWQTG
ncbi:MAG: phage integrase N-terminal SAM-like domain-containing protein [Lachnospiraceae bacterium]|nr:phage integrase N-terminal SAM-like domain-containing protein [Lachnospiraceae bacterium]